MATITNAQRIRFAEHVRQLNELLMEIREKHPGANYYLANDSLHLLSGPSHDDVAGGVCRARQDRSMAVVTLRGSGGGDW